MDLNKIISLFIDLLFSIDVVVHCVFLLISSAAVTTVTLPEYVCVFFVLFENERRLEVYQRVYEHLSTSVDALVTNFTPKKKCSKTKPAFYSRLYIQPGIYTTLMLLALNFKVITKGLR